MALDRLPSLMNYTRSIVPSEGIFGALKNGKTQPLTIAEKTVLGTIANYSSVYKGETQLSEEEIKKKNEAGDNNIQRVDACYLPPGFSTFQLDFTLKFLPNSLAPEACNNTEVIGFLKEISELYRNLGGYYYLAGMYLARICNGSFLWRNRYGTERTIRLSAPFQPEFEAITIDINDELAPFLDSTLKAKLKPWQEQIGKALSGESKYFLMKVISRVNVGEGQEIYPSQEFVDRGGKKSKTLFSLNVGDGDLKVAGMHSQKIGNAIRTIDIWYPDADVNRPLAIEPFTVDKRMGEVLRLPKRGKSDFYSYLKEVESMRDTLLKANSAGATAEELPGNTHYFMAVLIRGGVFSAEKKDK